MIVASRQSVLRALLACALVEDQAREHNNVPLAVDQLHQARHFAVHLTTSGNCRPVVLAWDVCIREGAVHVDTT